ncbi:hypothetical protein ETAA8_69160 [Anatilimnocola aggregata]|uniref:Uncharacterized protein n=1 Tax=Anatilimnocola aggregata TaxID=2528021 RepID=A0A517YNE6_9BACT|nr:hypothetical protein [Anatilimnocola aggregata]QDU31756.1 hypothetical protein ETAA8_69160 [Anatilimnocola aggregata]
MLRLGGCSWLVVVLLGLVSTNGLLGAEPTEQAKEKRERLAVHQTLAVLNKVEYRLCRGLTSLCPKECGHSGNFADFTIKKYLKYEKLGEFGDPKQENFLIQVSDFDKRPLGDPALLKTIQGLKAGDFVLLSWNHDYVTSKGVSSPERPVIKLEKIDPAQAETLLKASQ